MVKGIWVNVVQLNRVDCRFDYIPVGECLLALRFRAEYICRWRFAFAQETFAGPPPPLLENALSLRKSASRKSQTFISHLKQNSFEQYENTFSVVILYSYKKWTFFYAF
ncbi:hypothetical protein ACQKMI_19495 [Lysinibacillus sp. NPDC097214]|uniref:hypothetical protein n=1 Tax=Lysinibacillus sp. NPDC097214 TaxID=3390584 RepID=UPI003D053993